MKNQISGAIIKPWPPAVSGDGTDLPRPGRLVVNVIFTNPQATVAALKTARSSARDLGACIRVRAAIAVPYALPLDKPPVPVHFTERLLSKLVRRLELGVFEPSIHVYLCRDRIDTLLRVLGPNSLVVICGRKHWWATAESRMASALRSKGHRVVFVGLTRGTKSDLQ